MRVLLPPPAAGQPAAELDDRALAAIYAYPGPCWLRTNMVTSADGAGFLEGRTAALSTPGDMRVFGLLRVLADVVLVGAGTARVEEYKPARRRPALEDLRAGRPPALPIAVVSRKLDLDFATPLFAAAPPDARTIVITCAGSPADQRAAAARVADVIVAGDMAVDLKEALAALRDRGLGQVLCEGGPHLLGQLAAEGLLDELCLTVTPLLAGPGPTRVVAGAPLPVRRLKRAPVLTQDGALLRR
jgi:riboflavin biosynthesis pyrimidine reductase